MAAAEVESIIGTRLKVGYMLNFAKDNIVILRKKDVLFIGISGGVTWCVCKSI